MLETLFSRCFKPTMKELGAHLECLELSASQPRDIADFYALTFQTRVTQSEGCFTCHAAGRTLVFTPGASGQLRRAVFRFTAWPDYERYHDRHRQRLDERGQARAESGVKNEVKNGVKNAAHGITLCDPCGHLVSFLPPENSNNSTDNMAVSARLQHFALQTPQPDRLAAFYTEVLGFVVSDRVRDEQGDLTAVFMRTDTEHHSLALFRAPLTRFDHFSCEVSSWTALRDWADHMASAGVDLAWGIGRHGPGNDTFLMVRDMDGNMGEISSDMEICHPDRPVGIWAHRPQTLNRWGVAIMRS